MTKRAISAGHITRRVVDTRFEAVLQCFLSRMASYDVASTISQAVSHVLRRC